MPTLMKIIMLFPHATSIRPVQMHIYKFPMPIGVRLSNKPYILIVWSKALSDFRNSIFLAVRFIFI